LKVSKQPDGYDPLDRNQTILLQAQGISKGFPGVWEHLILDHIDFDVRAGEVHTLLGENGAGKTVIANILSGYYGKTDGEILVNGQSVTLNSPLDGLRHGIGMVHQELMLVPTFTVAENIMLGLHAPVFSFRRKMVEKQIQHLSSRYGLKIDPTARVEALSAGEQQRVEIIKVLFHEPKVLLLDEPTSLLTPQEADDLFVILRAMTDEGKGIVFITHKMREVFEVSDRVTVLKLGKTCGTRSITETSEAALTRETFGEILPTHIERPAVESEVIALEARNLVPEKTRQEQQHEGFSIALRQGEIIGLAGVAGNGQTELIECLTGLRPARQGQIFILGQEMSGDPPRAFIEQGVAHIPERRREMGIVEDMFVAENIVLKDYAKAPFSKYRVLNHREITRHAHDIVSKFKALVPDLWQTESRILSGGNIQRLILGRETWNQPPIIIAAHPTEGLDAKAIRHTWECFLELRAMGSAILVISEDLDEILCLADRVSVVHEGRLIGSMNAAQADRQTLGQWMTGSNTETAKRPSRNASYHTNLA
jgi:simple sugar transport system ATP-binding protein